MIFKKKISVDLREKEYFTKKNVLLLIAGLAANLAAWAVLYAKIKPQTEPVFLHYNIYYGVDLIGEWYRIFIMPLTGLAVCFINYFFSYIIYKKGEAVSYLILGLNITLQLLILLSSLLIIRQNS